MSSSVTPSTCSFNVFNGCRMVGNQLYVTGQPDADTNPTGYAQIAQAGVQWVLSVRDPDETNQTPPVDPNEATTLLHLNVLYANVPLAHGISQPQFNDAATVAAVSMLGLLRLGKTLIHCTSGDRASSVVAVVLIASGLMTNIEAEAFAVQNLLLDTFKSYVLAYQTPSWFGDLPGVAAQARANFTVPPG